MFRKIKLLITIYKELKYFKMLFPCPDENVYTENELKHVELYRYSIFDLMLQVFDNDWYWNIYRAPKIFTSEEYKKQKIILDELNLNNNICKHML